MIVPKFYENLHVLHDGTMPARSYYIPASKRMDGLIEHRETSDRILFLNGVWKFLYFKSIYDVTHRFFEPGYDTSCFEDMIVPGIWQTAGYDTHQYTNIRYPFPFDPPYVPQDIPCGAYICNFDYHKDHQAPEAYLNFEGVDSCFYVWLNGIYIGYSQVSHATSEFDVTNSLNEGNNTIAVLVLKWCDGSYLEDQDKFRMSGIFRDVYLLKRPEQFIWDYHTTTSVKAGKAEVKLEISYIGNAVGTKISIYDTNNQKVAAAKGFSNTFLLEVTSPALWSAEAPNLYTLVIETENEVITDHIGFRTIRIRDGILYLNNQNIKFHGVNRHDSDPVTGFSVSIRQLLKDLTMMKQHNFNAIRSSHYPNAPYFYQLCDKYGFMVIDEADIEAHGPVELYYKEDTDENRFKHWNEKIADAPSWENAILDRVQRMVQRDKNRPSVIIWSMGNESAYGRNFETALKWTKTFDPTRLTQYESARYRNHSITYDYKDLDLYSRMYPAFDEIREYLEQDRRKPYLLVEYCHSMGNGPGDFEDYFQLIQKDDRICGGFVWEWCDHGIYAGKSENGKKRYLYGGDFDESVHDGNFCMDGLVYPDRTPHTGLLEYKNVHRPVRVVAYNIDKKQLTLHNYLDFTDLKDYASISYEVTCDGICTESGNIPAFSVKPHEESSVGLCITIPETGRVYLKVTYKLLKETEIVPAGHVLGFDEILLENADGRNQDVLKWIHQKYKWNISADLIEADLIKTDFIETDLIETDLIETDMKVDTTGTDGTIKVAMSIENTNIEKLPVNTDFMEPAEKENKVNTICKIAITQTNGEIILNGKSFQYVYSKKTGLFESMHYAGREYLDKPMEINIWRAPTDNDMYIKTAWKKARYNNTYVRAYTTIVEQSADKDKVIISNTMSVSAVSIQRIMDIKAVWIIDSSGDISTTLDVVKDPEFPELPRFGIRLFLTDRFTDIMYYGYGPFESYCDKHQASSHGLYHANVRQLHEDYIRPQENGSHFDCDYVIVSDGPTGLATVSEQSFSFNASVYTQEELEAKSHNFELEESGSMVLCIDYVQNGIGSNSCGPAVSDRYRFDDIRFRFQFKLIPFIKMRRLRGYFYAGKEIFKMV